MKEYGISVEREWDVELVKDELEEQIVYLLPQEQINFGFMNGYGGILYQCLQDISVPGSHIEWIGCFIVQGQKSAYKGHNIEK